VACDTELATSAAQTWELIRNFNAMPSWNDAVRQSHIENGPADRIGCLRVLVFDDGSRWIHRLTGLSDVDMKLQYRIVETPQPMAMPIWNYCAEMCVIAAYTGRASSDATSCRVTWQASFETLHPEKMNLRARQVFERGFVGLRRLLAAEPASK